MTATALVAVQAEGVVDDAALVLGHVLSQEDATLADLCAEVRWGPQGERRGRWGRGRPLGVWGYPH